ncbi:acyltransferase [Agrobacterium sp. SOY23]|uniref:acyltransferase family protein n=1 Tax=Agrobacterium sp. SOY23 TaxID=3014555 RepID=UPI0022AFD374|nr:acyltransferase [Agrobacterium sp. SOY23]MCZ4428958.1 acyltransferase [Agrobacterium sp. SOY23]
MIFNLQVLRAVAAYLVFFHHFVPNLTPYFPNAKSYEFGAAGVDIFFVLSGFIMVVTTFNKESDPFRFMLNRIVRIVPMYWIVTLFVVALFVIGFRPVGVMELRADYIFNSLFFIPFTRNGLWEPILSVGWTLNYEMFFYVVFASLLPIKNFLLRICFLSAVLAIFVASGEVLPLGYMAYYAKPIILDFVFGVAIGAAYLLTGARWSDNKTAASAGWSFLILGVVLIVATGFGLGLSHSTGIFRPLSWGVAGFLLVSGCVLLEKNGFRLKNKWIIELGNASYSIYLIHNLLIQTSAKAVNALWGPGILSVALAAILALFATTLLSLMAYRFVEAPLNQAYRRRSASAPKAEAAVSQNG